MSRHKVTMIHFFKLIKKDKKTSLKIALFKISKDLYMANSKAQYPVLVLRDSSVGFNTVDHSFLIKAGFHIPLVFLLP